MRKRKQVTDSIFYSMNTRVNPVISGSLWYILNSQLFFSIRHEVCEAKYSVQRVIEDTK